jgi:hypothetical protein
MHVLLEDGSGQLILRRMTPWHRLLARGRAAGLDRRLADGARPESDPVLAARAMMLTSARYRRALAASLRRLAGAAVSAPTRPRPMTAARSAGAARQPYVPLRRDRIARSATELAGLADRLAARQPVPARGVALVCQLLSDGGGPLYRTGAREDLGDLIDQAAQALAR